MLSDRMVTKALRYNERQSVNVSAVQELVGAPETGKWDEATVQAVCAWQGRHGLHEDGCVGPRTWERMQAEIAPEEPRPHVSGQGPVLGVWVDDHRMIRRPEIWDEMRDHGISSVALMFEGHSSRWDPYYSEQDIDRLCKLADDRKMVVGLTDWPRPNRAWIDQMHEDMMPLYREYPLVFAESDLEGNWLPSQVHGFPNLDKAGDYLVQCKKDIVRQNGARFESTTYTSHTENGRAADVAPHCDRIFGQAYSVRGRSKKNPKTGKYDVPWQVPWDHSYGPGHMQKLTLDRSDQVPGVPERIELGCGLAAYDQKWPGHSAQEAMEVAYRAAIQRNVVEIRFWSFKWIFGRRATSYGRPFLQSLLK